MRMTISILLFLLVACTVSSPATPPVAPEPAETPQAAPQPAPPATAAEDMNIDDVFGEGEAVAPPSFG